MLSEAVIAEDVSARFVILSGASGGGKSTLLDELARRGHRVVPEPGRRIVAAERAANGAALPWNDPEAFARKAIAMALADRAEAARHMPPAGDVFFDRGLIDAAAALAHATGEPAVEQLGRTHRHAATVFLAPPWPDIFRRDDDRRHDFADGEAEYHRLVAAYRQLGYRLCELPRIGVHERADHVLAVLEERRQMPD